MTRINLQNLWERHDWQRSPFAPNLHIVQALLHGKTASGAGFSRYDALLRCMGETAEIISLIGGESGEGVAAGPDFHFASEQALKERLERWALWGWWHGQLPAQPIQADSLIAKLRRGAVAPRETKIWHISAFPYICVAIAQSRSSDGTQPILGFGADSCPRKATFSALIELGLMELNLSTPTAKLDAYFNLLNLKAPACFPATPPAPLASLPNAPPLQTTLPKDSVSFSLVDRTPDGIDLTVVKAEIPQAPSWIGIAGPLL